MVASSVSVARGTQQSANLRSAQTLLALNTAKQALVNYATSVQLSTVSPSRPGELPCPDLNNDGFADPPCGTSATRLGRLPWKTLGLPDLRDGTGERLWYAVSASFVNNPRTSCAVPTDPGCLNSNTSGTITVRDQAGNVTNDGTIQATAAMAVVIAPGLAVTRFDGVAQDRSCTGDSNVLNCQLTRVCTGPSTALCNPVNYLDISPSGQDNKTLSESPSTNGFITGPISDSNNIVRLNDAVTAVSYADLMPVVQRRVAQEVMRCLQNYAADYTVNGGQGHFPWASSLVNQFPTTGYFTDKTNTLFGRVPDSTQLSNTRIDSGSTMSASWTSTCNLGFNNTSWWMNWKELVFYSVADACSPTGTGPCSSTCATVTTATPTTNPQVVVLVAGRTILAESRSTDTQRNTASNYLEGVNASGGTTYQASASTSDFNDTLAVCPSP